MVRRVAKRPVQLLPLSVFLWAGSSMALPEVGSGGWRSIGDPGNPQNARVEPDTGATFDAVIGDWGPEIQSSVGSVPYAFDVTADELTVGIWIDLLNAVAADGNDTCGLWHPDYSHSPTAYCREGWYRGKALLGGNCTPPVITQTCDGSKRNCVYSVPGSVTALVSESDFRNRMPFPYANFHRVARLANWLGNGRPAGDCHSTTDTGTYDLTLAVCVTGDRVGEPCSDDGVEEAIECGLNDPAIDDDPDFDACRVGYALERSPGWRFAVPSLDEIMKAYYYDPETRDYACYPIQDVGLAQDWDECKGRPFRCSENPSERCNQQWQCAENGWGNCTQEDVTPKIAWVGCPVRPAGEVDIPVGVCDDLDAMGQTLSCVTDADCNDPTRGVCNDPFGANKILCGSDVDCPNGRICLFSSGLCVRGQFYHNGCEIDWRDPLAMAGALGRSSESSPSTLATRSTDRKGNWQDRGTMPVPPQMLSLTPEELAADPLFPLRRTGDAWGMRIGAGSHFGVYHGTLADVTGSPVDGYRMCKASSPGGRAYTPCSSLVGCGSRASPDACATPAAPRLSLLWIAVKGDPWFSLVLDSGRITLTMNPVDHHAGTAILGSHLVAPEPTSGLGGLVALAAAALGAHRRARSGTMRTRPFAQRGPAAPEAAPVETARIGASARRSSSKIRSAIRR